MFDESGPLRGGVVEPALARTPAGRGRAGAPARQAAPRGRVLGDRARAVRRRGGPATARGAHGRARAGAPRHRGDQRGAAAPAHLGRLRAHLRTPSSRSPAGCARPSACPTALPRWPRRTSPTARRTSRARAGGSRSRSCSCSSSPWPAAAGRAARAAARRPLAPRGVVVDRWRWSLPFELTGDQRQRRWRRSTPTWPRERPMQRLLMGEVGSGKTVCALQAMLRAVENGAQAALMAPTETLAEQHHRTLDSLLGGHLPVELLTGSTPAARRRDLLGRLASGPARAGGRHPRADRATGGVPRAGGRRGRRAAPLRRAPARRARREGARRPRPARAAHDRHADPAHALADGLRRPRRHRAARAPQGPPAGRDLRGRRRARAGARLRAHPRGDRGRAASASSSARWSRSPRRSRPPPPPRSTSACAPPSSATSKSS